MSLHQKTLLILSLLFLICVSTASVVAHHSITKLFLQLERTQFEPALEKIGTVIASRLESIDGKLSDWAAWDDMYRYVKVRS